MINHVSLFILVASLIALAIAGVSPVMYIINVILGHLKVWKSTKDYQRMKESLK